MRNRACLLCVGKKSLHSLIESRIDSNKKDYMKHIFSIPIKEKVSDSALNITFNMKKFLPEDEYLHAGYGGEECRDMLVCAGLSEKYVICGIESPGCGYKTYDIVFPQGKCEKGESSKETAVREFGEETGIVLKDDLHTIFFLGFAGDRKEMKVYLYNID
jgi:hypothetical protein